MNPPDVEYLRKILTYKPETGLFVWNARTPDMFTASRNPKNHCAGWNTRHAGKPALTLKHTHGYLMGPVLGKQTLAHRVAWAVFYGSWPEKSLHIDHLNRDKTDNRIENLRIVTPSQNMENRGLMSNNSSGFKGVSWDKRRKKWRAQLNVDSKCVLSGAFPTKELAVQAYQNAQDRYEIDAAWQQHEESKK